EASETALVIPVPEAEPAVGRWRDRLDPACTLGVPAHITVLYPFVPPSWLDQTFVDELGELLGGVGAFEFELTEVRWFDEDVVWVEPKPAEPFLRLTELVVARWPEFPPYQGAHAELVPHLTIAQDCPRREMEEAAAAVARSEEHTSELQSRENLVCRLLLEKKKQPETEEQPKDDYTVR